MIEAKVPKDVRAYKTKVIGPLTMRQLICLVLAIALDIMLYSILKGMGVTFTPTLVVYGIMFIDLPILVFIIEVQGMPLEKYLSKVVIASFLKPTKRKAQNLLYEEQKKEPLSKQELKKREKMISQIGNKNKELKAFE